MVTFGLFFLTLDLAMRLLGNRAALHHQANSISAEWHQDAATAADAAAKSREWEWHHRAIAEQATMDVMARYWVGSTSGCSRVNVSDCKPGFQWEHQHSNDASAVDIVGKVLESDPPRRLVYTWARPSPSRSSPPVPMSRARPSPSICGCWPMRVWSRT